jgi:hypothetical protein
LALLPARASEPRNGGVTEVRIAFNLPPGTPSGPGVALAQATCESPEFAAYAGACTITSVVEGQELVVSFTPGLENGRSYRMTLAGEITSVAGQTVEFRGLLGDVTGDGLVNATDRSEVVGIWTGGGFSCDTDLDGDGLTNAVDRSLTVAAWTGGGNCAP